MPSFGNSSIRLIIRIFRALRVTTLDRYILSEFFSILGMCLIASTGLFLVFDTFERIRVFLRNDTHFLTALQYISLKIPLIIQLMIPMGVLIATLISLGRLSQKSELTAMRAGGLSIVRIASPLLLVSILFSAIMFINGEYVVPHASKRMDEILEFDIKQKHLSGNLSRANFWFREGNSFLNLDYFDSATKTIKGISRFSFNDNFKVTSRVDSLDAAWSDSSYVEWSSRDGIEIYFDDEIKSFYRFSHLPLKISKTPEDLYNLQRDSESFGYFELKEYIQTLSKEGVDTRKYEVDLAGKASFPLVCFFATLVAIPFAFTSARSGTMTRGFIVAVCIGFGYYITHAICSSLASAGFLPIMLGAWSANIFMLGLGLILLGGAEFRSS